IVFQGFGALCIQYALYGAVLKFAHIIIREVTFILAPPKPKLKHQDPVAPLAPSAPYSPLHLHSSPLQQQQRGSNAVVRPTGPHPHPSTAASYPRPQQPYQGLSGSRDLLDGSNRGPPSGYQLSQSSVRSGSRDSLDGIDGGGGYSGVGGLRG
ncbi:unnamed protein product, partial [Meganyctiphanes norvegica]